MSYFESCLAAVTTLGVFGYLLRLGIKDLYGNPHNSGIPTWVKRGLVLVGFVLVLGIILTHSISTPFDVAWVGLMCALSLVAYWIIVSQLTRIHSKNLLYRLFPSKNLKKLKSLLNSLDKKLNNPSFTIVRQKIETWAIKNPNDLKTILSQNIDHELWLIGHTANISGDLLEGGTYNLPHGILMAMSPGEDLLKLFDRCTDLSVEKGEFDNEAAKKQKGMIRANIRRNG